MLEMWVLWLVLGGFVAFYGLRCLKDARNLFAPPLILALLVFGVLVKSYYEFDDLTLAAFLDKDYYFMTLAYAAVCMIAFCLPYHAALRRPPVRSMASLPVEALPRRVITFYVAAIAVISFGAQALVVKSAGGFISAYSQVHGQGIDYADQSAYLYALPNFLWSALLIGYVALIRRGRTPFLLALTLIVAGALFAHTFLFGNRNGVIRFAIILGGAWVFIRRPSLSRSVPLAVLLAFAVAAVLVIPHIRQSLHLGSDVSVFEALNEYFEQLALHGGKTQLRWEAAGHEFFFNIAVVQATWVSSTYDFGAQFIYPIINFVPRVWWPAKPYEVDFGVNVFALVRQVVGWDAGAGSAISGVGWSFLAFSWLGSFIWGIFGWLCGRAVRAAWHDPSMMNLAWLISFLLGCIYWGTQSFSAVFSAMFFTIMPFIGLNLIARLMQGRSGTPFGRSPGAKAWAGRLPHQRALRGCQ